MIEYQKIKRLSKDFGLLAMLTSQTVTQTEIFGGFTTFNLGRKLHYRIVYSTVFHCIFGYRFPYLLPTQCKKKYVNRTGLTLPILIPAHGKSCKYS